MSYRSGTVCWAGETPPDRTFPLVTDDQNYLGMEAVVESVARVVPVIFTGTVGAGKTSLMREIDVRLRERDGHPLLRERRPWLDEPAWWTTAAGYVVDVRSAFTYAKKHHDWSDDYSADGIARRVRRLFIDDVGVERDANDSRFASQTISQLLHDRHAAGLPTWITMNLSWPEFSSRYDERTASRLLETSLIVHLEGGDRRVPMRRADIEPYEATA